MSNDPQYPQRQNRGGGGGGNAKPRARKNRSGKKTPFRAAERGNHAPAGGRQGGGADGNRVASPSQVADMMRQGEEAKSGQFAEQLAEGNKAVKKERLHKVLAQSGHGSRRDMEILIAGGRVTINGNAALAGAHVSPGDKVLIDNRLIPIKFAPELPRVLLYHKPEGEIVTTSDPGNRITVFDNLPRVENGKWIAIGRLDFNTSGLLIFTTSGELANKMMHPRFEVEREYAVRILGELTEEQIQRLLGGIQIDAANENDDDDEEEEHDDSEVIEHDRLARFLSIDKRGSPDLDKTTANNWYHVILKEGRNREIRRMFEALGLTVSRLMRVRFGKIELPPRLLRGKLQEFEPAQVMELLKWAEISTEGMEMPVPRQQGDAKRGQRHGRGTPGKVRGQARGQPRGEGNRGHGRGEGGQGQSRGEGGQGHGRGEGGQAGRTHSRGNSSGQEGRRKRGGQHPQQPRPPQADGSLPPQTKPANEEGGRAKRSRGRRSRKPKTGGEPQA